MSLLQTMNEKQLQKEYKKRCKKNRCVFGECENTDMCYDHLCEQHADVVENHKIFTVENVRSYIKTHDYLARDPNVSKYMQTDDFEMFACIRDILKARRHLPFHDSGYQRHGEVYHVADFDMYFKVYCNADLMYQDFCTFFDAVFRDEIDQLEYDCICIEDSEQSKYCFFDIPNVSHPLDIFFEYLYKQTKQTCKKIVFTKYD